MEHLCLLDTGNFISGPSVRSDPLSPLCILRLLLPSSLLSPPPSLPHCRAMAFLVGAREADLRPRPYLNHNSLYHQTSVERVLVRLFPLTSISSRGHAHSFILMIVTHPLRDLFIIIFKNLINYSFLENQSVGKNLTPPVIGGHADVGHVIIWVLTFSFRGMLLILLPLPPAPDAPRANDLLITQGSHKTQMPLCCQGGHSHGKPRFLWLSTHQTKE